jgi:hypothetical protein
MLVWLSTYLSPNRADPLRQLEYFFTLLPPPPAPVRERGGRGGIALPFHKMGDHTTL